MKATFQTKINIKTSLRSLANIILNLLKGGTAIQII